MTMYRIGLERKRTKAKDTFLFENSPQRIDKGGGWFRVDRWMSSFLGEPSIFSRKKKEHDRFLFK